MVSTTSPFSSLELPSVVTPTTLASSGHHCCHTAMQKKKGQGPDFKASSCDCVIKIDHLTSAQPCPKEWKQAQMSPLLINKSSASQLSSLLGRPPLSWNNQWWCVAAHSSGSVQKLPNEGRFSVWRSTGSCATNSALRYQQSTKGTTCFLQYTLHCNTLSCVLYCERTTAVCAIQWTV